MSSQADQSILRRKASARQSASGPTAMDIPKAMRFAMAKAGDLILQAPVGVRDVEEDTLLPDDIDTGLPDTPLLLRLEDDTGCVGLAVACVQTVGAVIEVVAEGDDLFGHDLELGAQTRQRGALVGTGRSDLGEVDAGRLDTDE